MQAKNVTAAVALLTLAAMPVSAQEIVPEDVPVKPRPAEAMPLASHNLLLDVVNTGERYIAVGDRGHVLGSVDGRNWAQVEVPVRAALTGVSFPTPKKGWAAGHDGAIVHTTDGGQTWALQNFEPDLEVPILDILFVDEYVGYAVGAYGLFRGTRDGGVSWEDMDAPEVRDEELHFNALVRLNNGELLLVGETGMMGISGDQGESWERLESPYESSLFGAQPLGAAGAVVFGLRGNAFATDNVRGGEWRKIQTGTVASLFGGTTLPDGGVAMVGLNGTILRTGPDASRVNRTAAPAGKPLAAVIATAEGLLVVGEAGASIVNRP